MSSFRVRDLIPNPDISSGAAARKSHGYAQSILSRRYKSFRSEVELRAEVDLDTARAIIRGRLDGMRRTRSGYCIYEIKPVPGRAKLWIDHPSLQSARWQLMLYCDLFRLDPHAGRKPDDMPAEAILLLVGSDGQLAEESLAVEKCKGLLSRRLFVMLQDRERSILYRGITERSLMQFIEEDVKHDREIQRAAGEQIQRHPSSDRVLISMPPGSGKTRIAFRLALQRAHSMKLPIQWITTKSEGRRTVMDEIARYRQGGVQLRHTWKTSAERICDCEQQDNFCHRRQCTRDDLFLHGTHIADNDTSICRHELQRAQERESEVVIADLNYLLYQSSLHRPAVRVFDEVQNLTVRVEEFHQTRIRASTLRRILRMLPASRRSRLRALVEPEWFDEDSAEVRPELWHELAALVHTSYPSDEAAETIVRIAGFLAEHASNYELIWMRDASGSCGWLGYLKDCSQVVRHVIDGSSAAFALSGSLPGERDVLNELLPGFNEFDIISPKTPAAARTAIVPLLDFRFPIEREDILAAVKVLTSIHDAFGASVAVYGQNREANEIMIRDLHTRGRTSLDERDVQDNWDLARDVRPDFIFSSLGSNLTESINPPPELFSCAAVLAPGFRPLGPTESCKESEQPEDDADPYESTIYLNSLRSSISRIIQSAGRVQRGPNTMQPVFLLNRAFVQPGFLSRWPGNWYDRSTDEIVFSSLEDAIVAQKSAVSASHPQASQPVSMRNG